MDSSSLTYKTLRNIFYSLFGYAWPILFSVLITPVVVHRLGITSYGIYILVNTVTAFLSLIDLGLNAALTKYIAEYHAKADWESLYGLLNSARSLYVLIGVLGLTIFVILGRYASLLFHISTGTQQQIWPVFLLAGLVFLISSLSMVYVALPLALQRYDISTKLNISQLTLLNLAMLGLVLFGFQLKAIFLANLGTTVLLLWAYRWYFKKLLPGIKLGYAWSGAQIKKIYEFGLLAAITNLASNSLIQLDRFIVPIFTGPGLLTYYSLPGNVAQKTYGLVGSLGTVFFPLTSAFSATGDLGKIKEIYKKLFRNFTLIAAGLTTAIVIFAYKILFYWLGKDFADRGTQILIILALTYFILAVYGSLTNFLLGMGQVKFLVYFSVSLAILNLVLLLSLVPSFGILGAAWAYLAAVLPVPFAFYWTEQKLLNLSGMRTFYLNLYAKLFATSILVWAIAVIFILPLTSSLPRLIIVGPLTVLLYFVLYKFLGFMDQEDWLVFKSFVLKFKQEQV